MRSRRLLAAGALMALLAAISAVIGTNMLTLISRGDPVAVPYLLVLDAFIAVLAVGSLASPVPAMDRGDVGVVARARWLHLAGMGALGLLLVVAASLPRSGMSAWRRGAPTWPGSASPCWQPASCASPWPQSGRWRDSSSSPGSGTRRERPRRGTGGRRPPPR